MRATTERLEGAVAFRSESEWIWNGRVDYPVIIAASLMFARHCLGTKIAFALFKSHPASFLWRSNSIGDP